MQQNWEYECLRGHPEKTDEMVSAMLTLTNKILHQKPMFILMPKSI